MKMIKKILIVCYAFPPTGGAGVQRVSKYVKYLRDNSWEPIVLTVENPSVPVADISLMKDVPEDVIILKAKSFEPSYTIKQTLAASAQKSKKSILNITKAAASTFLLPDYQVLWWPFLIFKIIFASIRFKPDCIFVSAPPFSSFIPVVFLGRLLNIPTIIDYRDQWSFARDFSENMTRNKFAYFLDSVFEKFVISSCSFVTTASKRYIQEIKDRYAVDLTEKALTITNGYDEDDFINLPTTLPSDDTAINILYAGTVWSATSLKGFCCALSELIAGEPDTKDKIIVNIYGRVVNDEMALITESDLGSNIKTHGYIEHSQIIQQMACHDVLLIVLSDLDGADKIITGKLFEYMASRKFILAIVPEGETKEILENNYDNYLTAKPGDLSDIKCKISYILANISKIRGAIGCTTEQFSRKNLTKDFVGVVNKVVNS